MWFEVNCNTYNADFDGDEMNLHCPQDDVKRVEILMENGENPILGHILLL
jgi:DNA-directed RNA polymerase I subunit RPA1